MYFKITLKIVEEKTKNKQKKISRNKNISEIISKINKVKSVQLKSSLNNFLKAFNERNK